MKYARRITNWAGTGLLALAVMAVGGAGLSAAPTKLTMVGSWPPKVSSAADIGIKYLDTVNKMGKGTVEITFKGSRDVVPTFDQPEALVRGLFDVWYGAPNYWAGVVPGGYFFELSPYDVPDKGPGSDLYNFIVKMYEKKGVRYVGHFCGEPSTGNHFMYTQKKISGHRRSQGTENPRASADPVLRQEDRRRAGDASAERGVPGAGTRHGGRLHMALL